MEAPRWVRDLRRFLPLRSQFVLTGNVRDRYPAPLSDTIALLPLIEYLSVELSAAGIQRIIAFDPVSGFYVPSALNRDNVEEDQTYFSKFGLRFDEHGRSLVSVERFFELLGVVVSEPPETVAVVVDFASRLLLRPNHLAESENRGFTRALVLAHRVEPRPHPQTRQPFFNPVIWIAEKEGDLPDWFTVDNPRLRHISIPDPDHVVRRSVARNILATAPGGRASTTDELDAIGRQFVEGTEGLKLLDLDGISAIMRSEQLDVSRITEAIRRYKLGVTEDPWRKLDRDKLADAEAFVRRRVKGQDRAVRHMLDIIMRAATGVGGGRGGRPRGVAFLAGPTGVGKTELAKTITELLFGDERAYIRFDMSEFSAEHADQRLIGAPPGYVGYDTGGELTNAIRQRPFSVVLFDEIEKAHPRILDKFLQVLDDGALTSGRGERVYFSESLILFTSNLGMSALGDGGRRYLTASAEDDYETLSMKVKREIERHFKLEIGRPEILNRIGENVIVFDYVRPSLARDIFSALLTRTLSEIRRDLSIDVVLATPAMAALEAHCLSDLSNGGRGIRNALEAAFVNPLARLVFVAGKGAGSSIHIGAFRIDECGAPVLEIR